MLQIRKAEESEFLKLRAFYNEMVDLMQDWQYKPGWKKDIYPSNEDLKIALAAGNLYIGEWDGILASAMIVNHEGNPSYEGVQWNVDANEEEVLVLHALGTHPAFAHRGIGTNMVKELLMIAQRQHCKAVRLDVLQGNLPAEKLYQKLGFQYIVTKQMYYDDTGWTDFLLYEYELNE